MYNGWCFSRSWWCWYLYSSSSSRFLVEARSTDFLDAFRLVNDCSANGCSDGIDIDIDTDDGTSGIDDDTSGTDDGTSGTDDGTSDTDGRFGLPSIEIPDDPRRKRLPPGERALLPLAISDNNNNNNNNNDDDDDDDDDDDGGGGGGDQV